VRVCGGGAGAQPRCCAEAGGLGLGAEQAAAQGEGGARDGVGGVRDSGQKGMEWGGWAKRLEM
jgi:hypothetical protein